MTTIARPYVAAAFEYALSKQDLPAWDAMLKSAALIAKDSLMEQLLLSPSISSEQLAELFCDILGQTIDDNKRNFIYLLADKKRLSFLPEIAKAFEEAYAEHQKVKEVEVSSAIPLDDAYQQRLATVLSKRLACQVKLHCEVNPALLGGIIVRAGDKVFDGSVRGKLTRLVEFI